MASIKNKGFEWYTPFAEIAVRKLPAGFALANQFKAGMLILRLWRMWYLFIKLK